ncbi:MAG: thioredoxin [Treponema sp.]|jgi:thioredoxin 1|nr:thioredoxin [Treponema sp.]
MTVEITNQNFESEVLKSDKPVLVDFWAPWCGPCRILGPVVEQVAKENPNVKVCKVNVDNESSLASKYGIMGIPTLIYFKDGEVARKTVGAVSKDKILEMFD